MKPRERGFLLLRSHLGDPRRPVLSPAKYRDLAYRVQAMDRPVTTRELRVQDLMDLGCAEAMARHIVFLFSQEDLLDRYLVQAKSQGCVPITRVSPLYPKAIGRKLGWDAPACLFAKGDLELLSAASVSLVGSRKLREPNRLFAQAVGTLAAREGLCLVSGNARGADSAAQDACLSEGGRVISFLPDALTDHVPHENQLLVSEEEFDAPFSAQLALSRNRLIHTFSHRVFVAQSDAYRGGTWDGTRKNLQQGWSEVCCLRDGSESNAVFSSMGASLCDIQDLPQIVKAP